MDHFYEYLKVNWKNLLIAALVVTQILSLIFGWNGYSLIVALKTGTGRATVEFNDLDVDMDSTEATMDLDISSFVPRKPKYIAIHCTASKEGRNLTREDLIRIFRERGFSKLGYNYVIDIYGKRIDLLPLNANNVLDYNEICQGVKGFNSTTISICYIGGYDSKMKAKDTRTWSQKTALVKLLVDLKKQFPDAKIMGHRDFNGVHKECPVFNAPAEYEWIH